MGDGIGREWDGREWDGREWDGREWDGRELEGNGMEGNGMEGNGMEGAGREEGERVERMEGENDSFRVYSTFRSGAYDDIGEKVQVRGWVELFMLGVGEATEMC